MPPNRLFFLACTPQGESSGMYLSYWQPNDCLKQTNLFLKTHHLSFSIKQAVCSLWIARTFKTSGVVIPQAVFLVRTFHSSDALLNGFRSSIFPAYASQVKSCDTPSTSI